MRLLPSWRHSGHLHEIPRARGKWGDQANQKTSSRFYSLHQRQSRAQSFSGSLSAVGRRLNNLEPRVSPALCQRLVAGWPTGDQPLTKSRRNSGLEIASEATILTSRGPSRGNRKFGGIEIDQCVLLFASSFEARWRFGKMATDVLEYSDIHLLVRGALVRCYFVSCLVYGLSHVSLCRQ